MAEVRARVGLWTARLGPRGIVEALRATIVYRLEPESVPRRFPAVAAELWGGRLEPERAAAALGEIEEIARELGALPTARAVWSLRSLRRIDDSGLPVDHAAENLRDYFVAPDGRPLLAVLAEAVRRSAAEGRPVVLDTRDRAGVVRAAVAVVVGLAWTVAAWLSMPDVAFDLPVPYREVRPAQHGMPVWVAGWCLASLGLLALLGACFPTLESLVKKHAVVSGTLIGAYFFLLAWLTWL